MATYTLKYTIPTDGSVLQVVVDAKITTSDTENADGSYTITGISGTRVVGTGASAVTETITGLSTADGADDELFPNGNSPDHGFVDFNGLSYTVNPKTESADYSEDPTDTNGIVNFYQKDTPNYNYHEDSSLSEAATSVSVTCYATGSLIRTACGDVAVEHLRIGDIAVTASGVPRPIKWIGKRSFGGRFIIGNKDVLPVCIKAGALDENVPARDLWVSPHHAMYLDGLLIEAKDLVNGDSIVQAEYVDEIEYFHIELDRHDVILAEGAWSETFLDEDTRGMFHNAHEYTALYPENTVGDVRYYAPRLDSGAELEAVRQQLRLRAQRPHRKAS